MQQVRGSTRDPNRVISIEFIHEVQIVSLRNIKQEFRFAYNERPQQSGKSMIKGYIVSI